jgi:hypothetical protein
MIDKEKIIKDFTFLGKAFSEAADESFAPLNEASRQAYLYNPWFIPEFVRFAYSAWSEALTEEKIGRWLSAYPEIQKGKSPKTIGLIMAGNIPMVGLHDLLCVMASGNKALVKLSSSDEKLIPAVHRVLSEHNADYKDLVIYSDSPFKNFDAIIATGSNNSSRYFDYYFGKYPHIIRKNRNGAAVLTGHESDDDLSKLADDIFVYSGLGCRNVSKLYLPEGYEVEKLLKAFSKYSFFHDHHKYRNNYDYQKSILLINRIPHIDNGFLLFKEEHLLMSPISVIHTETYRSLNQLNDHLESIHDQLQCIISSSHEIKNAIQPGRSQFPELWDYADGVDAMAFLSNLG